MHNSATIDIDNASGEETPEPPSIRHWVCTALSEQRPSAEVSVRIVSAAESAELNQRYRGKKGPTNVLSFPADIPDFVESPLLGDIVICAAIVRQEASEQHKTRDAHWAHMLVHGTLHLLGYDHIEESDAAAMETLETTILGKLNFPPPYLAPATETLLP